MDRTPPATGDCITVVSRRSWRWAVITAATPCMLAAGWTVDRDAHRSGQPALDTVTFAEHVAPILYHSCTGCHHPRGPAPFDLLTYEDARARAELMAVATSERRMPPWLPTAGRGAFAGERRLSDAEIATLVDWAAAGAPEGDPSDLPAPPAFTGGWQLGQPDLVVTMPEPYVLAAGGGEQFRNFVLPVAGRETRWVRAIELDPGDTRAVHHAMVMVDPTPAARQLDARDPAPGWDGMHSLGNARMPEGFFLGWTPGRVPSPEPPGLAWRLDPGDDLVLQLHLRPRSEPVTIEARVALYLAESPPTRFATALRLGSETIDIAPGDPTYAIRDTFALPVDVTVLGVYPHAHYLAREMRFQARTPGGPAEWLLHIAEWDFNWQDAYRFARPVPLPRGSVLEMEFIYDNSASNPRNPNMPPKRVVYGPRSADEMGDLWVQVEVRDSADLAVLRTAFARKDYGVRLAGLEQAVRLRPTDGETQRQLANALLAGGRAEAALPHYERAVALDPDDGNAHYNFALALHGLGRLGEALEHYEAAARLLPRHVEAHAYAGNALVSLGRPAEAVPRYRSALAIAPERADVHYNLGVALLAADRAPDGIRALEESARLAPTWAAPLTTLAWTLATHGDDAIRDPQRATALAERAVALTRRRDAEALNALAAARAASGDFRHAMAVAEEGLQLAETRGNAELAAEIRQLRELYRKGMAFRSPER